MAQKTFDKADRDDEIGFKPTKPEGTVLKDFNGPTRRFVVDYVVTEADLPDLPRSLEDLKTGGFIA